jgi:DNA-binding CsgD family transcriptional regulator
VLDLSVILKEVQLNIGSNLPFGTCLIDYANRRYAYISEHCQEIISSAKDELEKFELQINKGRFHPDDKVIFDEQVFQDITSFLLQVPPTDIERYRFSYTHHYFRSDGSISHYLQQGTFLSSNDTGIPTLNLLLFTDVGDFKTDDTMTLIISYLTVDSGYVKVFSKSYSQVESSKLSSREREIIKLCMDGLSSNAIAAKLGLSIHTVKNHKRNIMEKTSTRKMAELINMAIKNHWL